MGKPDDISTLAYVDPMHVSRYHHGPLPREAIRVAFRCVACGGSGDCPAHTAAEFQRELDRDGCPECGGPVEPVHD